MIMKNIKKILIILIIAVLLFGGYYRYSSLNAFYENNYGQVILNLPMNSFIAFSDNKTNGFSMDGYEINITDASIIDIEKFQANHPQVDYTQIADIPERVCVIDAILRNVNSVEDGVYLPDFLLHGVDLYTDCNEVLTSIVNPALDGEVGIYLEQGTDFAVQIVYNLRKSKFIPSVWSNIQNYDLFLKLSDVPVRIEVPLVLSSGIK